MSEEHTAKSPRMGRRRCRNRPASHHDRADMTDMTVYGGQAADINVARQVRFLREERGLSIRALAELSGLAVNTLSLIENDKVSPSVNTLQQLAIALDTPITAFFEAPNPKRRVVYQRAHERQAVPFQNGTAENLCATFTSMGLQAFVITLPSPPLARCDNEEGEQQEGNMPYNPPTVHQGAECIFCINGSVEYYVDNQPYLLSSGDSLVFEATLPHSWRNGGDETATFLIVFCPFSEADQRGEMNFFRRATCCREHRHHRERANQE